jgi:hypothetical protein
VFSAATQIECIRTCGSPGWSCLSSPVAISSVLKLLEIAKIRDCVGRRPAYAVVSLLSELELEKIISHPAKTQFSAKTHIFVNLLNVKMTSQYIIMISYDLIKAFYATF